MADSGSNSAGEDSLVGRDDRLGRIDHVVVDLPGVGVDHDLDRVADVVHAGVRFRRDGTGTGCRPGAAGRRVAIGRGVGVPDPDQAPVGADEVRVAVVGEEWRELGNPLPERLAEEDLGVVGQTGR